MGAISYLCICRPSSSHSATHSETQIAREFQIFISNFYVSNALLSYQVGIRAGFPKLLIKYLKNASNTRRVNLNLWYFLTHTHERHRFVCNAGKCYGSCVVAFSAFHDDREVCLYTVRSLMRRGRRSPVRTMLCWHHICAAMKPHRRTNVMDRLWEDPTWKTVAKSGWIVWIACRTSDLHCFQLWNDTGNIKVYSGA